MMGQFPSENWRWGCHNSLIPGHSVSNQKVVGYIVNKNAKTQQEMQKRSLELLLNQQQTHQLASAVWSWLKPVRFQEFL